MSNVFEALAPRGPINASDDKWDVFLSYRSVNRPWVLRLYDQLRHLDYEVFMDQFVQSKRSPSTLLTQLSVDGGAVG